jgi:hypothetical protein
MTNSYAKCFTALTSSRRSRLANLPHFRLKNVVNIKAWISLRGGRTWLKRQGRQRAADEIVSTAFLIILVLLVVMGVQAVSDTSSGISVQNIAHVEVVAWCMLSRFVLELGDLLLCMANSRCCWMQYLPAPFHDARLQHQQEVPEHVVAPDGADERVSATVGQAAQEGEAARVQQCAQAREQAA